MADDIRSRAGLDTPDEAARRRRDGEARRAAAREAMTQEQMRERTMKEMEARRAAPPAPRAAGPANPRPDTRPRIPASTVGTVARAGSRAIPGMNVARALSPTSLEAGAEFEREGMRQARMEQARMRDRAGMEQEMGEAGDRMPTPRPAPRPVARPAPRRAEMSADRLNELAMGAEPMNAEERVAQMRMQGRRQELEDQGSAFKKGGMVKKKAGGMIAAKPKAAPAKMKKGGAVAKPKGKPMPFKKGGMIKKGRK